jgi:hypothetical protein
MVMETKFAIEQMILELANFLLFHNSHIERQPDFEPTHTQLFENLIQNLRLNTSWLLSHQSKSRLARFFPKIPDLFW